MVLDLQPPYESIGNFLHPKISIYIANCMIGRYYINFDKQIIDLLSISPSIFHHPLPIPAHRAHQKGPIFSSQVTQHRPTLVEAKAFAIQMVQAQCVLMYLPTKFGKTAHQNVGYYFRIKFCWRLQDYCWFCFFHEILFYTFFLNQIFWWAISGSYPSYPPNHWPREIVP